MDQIKELLHPYWQLLAGIGIGLWVAAVVALFWPRKRQPQQAE